MVKEPSFFDAVKQMCRESFAFFVTAIFGTFYMGFFLMGKQDVLIDIIKYYFFNVDVYMMMFLCTWFYFILAIVAVAKDVNKLGEKMKRVEKIIKID